MALGEYYYSIEEGRVVIPPKMRHHFREGVKFELMDGCIIAIPSMVGARMDRRGRVTIPPELRKQAQIGESVVVLFLDDSDFVAIYGERSWELRVGEELKRLARYSKQEDCWHCSYYDILLGRCNLEGQRTRPLWICTKFQRRLGSVAGYTQA